MLKSDYLEKYFFPFTGLVTMLLTTGLMLERYDRSSLCASLCTVKISSPVALVLLFVATLFIVGVDACSGSWVLSMFSFSELMICLLFDMLDCVLGPAGFLADPTGAVAITSGFSMFGAVS